MASTLRNLTFDAARFEKPLLVIAPHPQRIFADALAQAILDEAGARGWRVLNLQLTAGSLSHEPTPIAAITQELPTTPTAKRLLGLGCPVVRIGNLPHPDDEQMPAVVPDLKSACYMGIDYFFERGFRDIAMVGHEQAIKTRVMDQSMRARADELGCRYHLYALSNRESDGSMQEIGSDRYDRRTREITNWLRDLPKPIGLIATLPRFAGVISGMCYRDGLAMPEQVALLSLGDMLMGCQFGPVPLSAIDLSAQSTARIAMGLIDDLRAGRSVPACTYCPPDGIITRRSTDIVAIDNPTVARAVRFIWDHLDHNLAVADVAKAVKTPEHKLIRLFQRHFDRPVHAELRRARLERFAHLLRSTDLPVDQLAPQVGFANASYLTKVFRETHGLTPRQYRLQTSPQETSNHQSTS